MIIDYFLSFSGHFDRDRGLDQGRLRLDSLSKGNIDIWVASSSVSTKQGRESFHQLGGLIPPGYRCNPIVQWKVKLKPLHLPHVRGVEGNFYRILPFSVKTDNGGTRSDLGIHRDANVPGSMGCIVMSRKRFSQFERRMDKLRTLGILEIPLLVTYS